MLLVLNWTIGAKDQEEVYRLGSRMKLTDYFQKYKGNSFVAINLELQSGIFNSEGILSPWLLFFLWDREGKNSKYALLVLAFNIYFFRECFRKFHLDDSVHF